MAAYPQRALTRGAASAAAPLHRRGLAASALLAALALGLAIYGAIEPETASPVATRALTSAALASGGRSVFDGRDETESRAAWPRRTPATRTASRPVPRPARGEIAITWSADDAADFRVDDLPEAVIDDLGDADALAWLARRLEHADPARREAAALAIGDIGGPATPALLEPLLDDADRDVRLAAIDALVASGDPANWRLLEPLLFTGERSLRLRAVDSLAALHHPGSVHALAALLADGDVAVRRAAAAALDEIDGALARAYLQPLRYDPDPSVRASIEQMRAEWRLAVERRNAAAAGRGGPESRAIPSQIR